LVWFAGILAAYLLIAYLLLPFIWKQYEQRHPALDNAPGITITGDKHPGDPLNVGLIGSEEDLKRVMAAAKWFPADPLGLKADLKIAADTVLKREYDKAPVSNLFLYGRKEDFAFEQPVGGDPSRRHHVRFWKARELDAWGRPLWFGSATYDKRVGLSDTTGQITHHIDGNVDAERDHLLGALEKTGGLSELTYIDNFHPNRTGRNGGGDLWETDGRLGLGTANAPSVK
jgi:hypothetical protein